MESLFYIFCTTLPSHIIPFALFWKFQWRSRSAALALVTVNVVCKMAVAYYCVTHGIYFRNLELLFAVLGFLVYVCLLRLNPFKMLFTYLLIVDYLLIVRGIGSFFCRRFLSFHRSRLDQQLSMRSVLYSFPASASPFFSPGGGSGIPYRRSSALENHLADPLAAQHFYSGIHQFLL